MNPTSVTVVPLFVALLAATLTPSTCHGGEDPRAELQGIYDSIAKAIINKDAKAIVASGYRWRNESGVLADSQDVERFWNHEFTIVRAYGPVRFQIDSLEVNADRAIASVRRQLFFTVESNERQQFEQTQATDTWKWSGDTWVFADHEEVLGAMTGEIVEPVKVTSPRLVQLARDVEAQETDALEDFWRERAGHGPLVEDSVNGRTMVTMLFRGDEKTKGVRMRGGPATSSDRPFEGLPGSNLWYLTDHIPSDAQFVYMFYVTTEIKRPKSASEEEAVDAVTYSLDPTNPRTFNGASVLELSGAQHEHWFEERKESARGSIELDEISSAILGETRSVSLYRPPAGFDVTHASLAVFLDGEACVELMHVPTVLDNLIADKRIPPTIALFVHSRGSRDRDLVYSDAFVEFLARELVPWAERRLEIDATPRNTLIAGVSLGGLTASYAALKSPEVFGNVLSQSGAFWRPRPEIGHASEGWLPGWAMHQPAAQVQFFLEVGALEPPSMIENNRRMRDVLRATRHDVVYREYPGGHDHFNWRDSVADGLVALLGDATAK
jgi:enterochelin esterase-like enzyme